MDRPTKGAQNISAAVVQKFDVRSIGDHWDVGSGNRNVVRNVEIQKGVTANGAASVTKKHA